MSNQKPYSSFVITLIALLLLSLNGQTAFGQKEGNIWYFGKNAGVDFNYSPPKALTDSKMNTLEGCASVADPNGDLLFYTDGSYVWNKQHQVMDNGQGLKGNQSSTQSSIIVPDPASIQLYYIFTVDGATGRSKGGYYNKVDMRKDSGLGGVVAKNETLIDLYPDRYGYESIGATNHRNLKDYWVCYVDESTTIASYLVSKDGVNHSPVKSEIYKPHTTSFDLSHYMKFSSDNKFMAVDIRGYGLFLSKFDDVTGKFSPAILIPMFDNIFYSMEFSPNSKVLYTGNGYQFDISVFDSATIVNSAYRYMKPLSRLPRAIQLAPNGKIYISQNNQSYLGVINSPDLRDINCDYVINAIDLKGRDCTYGLPTFLQTYLKENIEVIEMCLGDSTRFKVNYSGDVDSVNWDFGETGSSLVTTDSLNTVHMYAETGEYTVTAEIHFDSLKYIIQRRIEIRKPNRINLGLDDTLCQGETKTLDAHIPGGSYKWHNGYTISQISAKTTGKYFVQVFDGKCYSSDTINLVFSPKTKIDLGMDTTLCNDDSLTLTVKPPDLQFEWQDLSTLNPYTVTNSGTYVLTVLNECFSGDTIHIEYQELPANQRLRDTTICIGGEASFDLTNYGYETIYWFDSTENMQKLIRDEGNYIVRFRYKNCSFNDSVEVKHKDCNPIIALPNVFTPNGDGLNELFEPITLENVEMAQMNVYNRWGEVIFSGDLLKTGWNGKSQGVEVPAGTYFWIVSLEGFAQEAEVIEGVITLIR